jgi:hypothetical protein
LLFVGRLVTSLLTDSTNGITPEISSHSHLTLKAHLAKYMVSSNHLLAMDGGATVISDRFMVFRRRTLTE